MIYLQLFLSFLQIGAFSFGGGYAAMPLIQSQVVDHHGWLTMQDVYKRQGTFHSGTDICFPPHRSGCLFLARRCGRVLFSVQAV